LSLALASVVGASLMGSLHCAGMCGPLAAFAAGSTDAKGMRTSAHVYIAYHGSRLVAYVTLGAVAGAVGAAVDLVGQARGIGHAAGVFAGVVMLAWGLMLLLRALGLSLPVWRWTRGLFGRVANWMAKARSQPPVLRSVVLGLCSALLPCGWLYAFAVAAAGTGSSLWGMLVMGAFWLGTVPALLGVAMGATGAFGSLRKHAPILGALTLIVLGLWGVLGRFHGVGGALDFESSSAEPKKCH